MTAKEKNVWFITSGSPIYLKTELVWNTVQSAVTSNAIKRLFPAW